jgi:tRNA-intron lyase
MSRNLWKVLVTHCARGRRVAAGRSPERRRSRAEPKMESSDLSEPRRKRVRRNVVLGQPYPVPIETYSGTAADNATWRWYEAELVGEGARVGDPGSARMLSEMGFFGELRAKVEEKKESLVVVEDFDPRRPSELRDDEEEKSGGSSETERDGTDGGRTPERVLLLADCEALFLAKALGCLLVAEKGEKDPLTLDRLWKHFSDLSEDFPLRYAVYHHFRSKNWVVKDGTKYGGDFLLYKDGPPFYHATYSVRIQANHPPSWTELAALNRVTESAAKELLLVQVDESSAKGSLDDYLRDTRVKEVVVKRWVPSQKREPAKLDK